MGNAQRIQKCSFEDIQGVQRGGSGPLLMYTFSHEDGCMIRGTLTPSEEERRVNGFIREKRMAEPIILYGRNTNDARVVEKYQTLVNYGFTNVFVYIGGMFEWLCLQDIYGEEEFPTTAAELDLLRFRPQTSGDGRGARVLQLTDGGGGGGGSGGDGMGNSGGGFIQTIKNMLL
jgi:hypothetical protein